MSKQDIDRIEKELIEQEHRPIRVITNFINRKNLFPDDLEKQNSTKKAILWRIFFSPGVVATVGGGIAIISLLVLIYQNQILKNQNKLIENQNNWFQQQIKSSEVSNLKNILIKDNIDIEQSIEVFREYVYLKKEIDSLGKKNSRIYVSNIKLNGNGEFTDSKLFQNVTFTNVDFEGARFRGVDFTGTVFNNCKFNPLVNEDLVGKKSTGLYNYWPSVFYKCDFSKAKIKNETLFFAPLFIECNFSNKDNYSFRNITSSTLIKCTVNKIIVENRDDFDFYFGGNNPTISKDIVDYFKISMEKKNEVIKQSDSLFSRLNYKNKTQLLNRVLDMPFDERPMSNIIIYENAVLDISDNFNQILLFEDFLALIDMNILLVYENYPNEKDPLNYEQTKFYKVLTGRDFSK